MTSRRRLQRRWLRWMRWSAKEPRLGSVGTRGLDRAYNALARWESRRAYRRQAQP